VAVILINQEKVTANVAFAGAFPITNDVDQVRAFEAYAVDVKGWCDASDYLAKQDDSRHWGADRELAKGSTKAGRAKGKHPFGLLATASAGDKQAGAKFIEYAAVMKGKRQLFWSSGLKTEVGLVERTDEELAEEERDSAEMLGLLDLSDWKLVREAGKRAQLLDAAESGGWPAVQALIRSLMREKVRSLKPSLHQCLLHQHAVNTPTRRRSAMQVVELSNDEKSLFSQVGKALYGQPFQDKTREIIGAAPAPRVDEEFVYWVAENDMPTHVWPAFRLMHSWGYAEKPKNKDPEQEGEVLLVDGSILDLLMNALQRVLEALLGAGDSSGSPPSGQSLKARPSRRNSLLLEHEG
jgi:hypothetical protein